MTKHRIALVFNADPWLRDHLNWCPKPCERKGMTLKILRPPLMEDAIGEGFPFPLADCPVYELRSTLIHSDGADFWAWTREVDGKMEVYF